MILWCGLCHLCMKVVLGGKEEQGCQELLNETVRISSV